MSPAERFWSKVKPAAALECWNWTASKRLNGYGQFKTGLKNWLPHRYAYEQLRGPIPDGLVLDHLCETRAWVNPWHLEPVSVAENQRRAIAGKPGWRGALTHCKHGHEFTPENTTRYGVAGKRACRICAARRQSEYTQRLVAA